ncbi:PREDICTED: tRNA (guanine-N(7)-)-methyltransferase-like [Acropora digitifera]|uniref:tRNA (guanine-N(7)-)-methyltransferase-like n=1 Tax=Acropora digitifera TaxID=70779 RepID=UPI00077A75CC|nr:PREDICTED: tRNA (guanine-N(7)-)-methyltransferase-like [Acropora digitifera]
MAELPQKKYYRQRAHANPMADHTLEYPVSPDMMDWRTVFPAFYPEKIEANGNSDRTVPKVEFADIGCGYGGLLVDLSPMFPNTLMVGMEIRLKVYLYDWMKKHFTEHPLFQAVEEDELAKDPVVEKLYQSTEEGQKVTRNKGVKLVAVFRRIQDPYQV